MRYLSAVLLFLLLAYTEPVFAANFYGRELVTLSASSTASSVSFANADSATYTDCLVTNTGSVGVFLVVGNTAASASASNGSYGYEYYIAPGVTMIIYKGSATSFSGITASGTATLYMQAGSGT